MAPRKYNHIAGGYGENSIWTRTDNKRFENCLVQFPDGTLGRWEMIAACMENKSASLVERHYDVLLQDIAAIEAGLVEMPPYPDMDFGDEGGSQSPEATGSGKKSVASSSQRKAGKPWTKEEHRRFLDGLKQFGKGDWKSISRYVVKTRNPTQVASHAQKYFERQDREDPNKKRKSIFDCSTSDPKPELGDGDS